MPWHRFTYGPMGSGKSSRALDAWSAHRRSGTAALLLSGGDPTVTSRDGSSVPAVTLGAGDTAAQLDRVAAGARHVLVDEAHMLPTAHVHGIVTWCDEQDVDIAAFGVLLDFRGCLFPATVAWLERVDEAVALPVVVRCWCGERAARNGRVSGDRMVTSGPQLVRGDLVAGVAGDVAYVSLCRRHWQLRMPFPG